MAPSHRAKRRKSVPSQAMLDEAQWQAKKKKKKKNIPRISALKPTVEAAHERAEQARAVQDMATHAVTASQLDHAAGQLERHC